MSNTHRAKSIVEAITHVLGITLIELIEGGENRCEIGIARRIAYLMKQFCLPMMTDEEFYQESSIHLLGQFREEITPMEKLLFEQVRLYYYRLLSNGESTEPESNELVKKAG